MYYMDTKQLNSQDTYTCIIGRRGTGKAYARYKYLYRKINNGEADEDEREYYNALRDWLVIENAEKIS